MRSFLSKPFSVSREKNCSYVGVSEAYDLNLYKSNPKKKQLVEKPKSHLCFSLSALDSIFPL